MKYGLLVGKGIAFKNTSDGYKNIGDYIQNIAAMQYLPTIDDYIDRESLYEGKEKIKVIIIGAGPAGLTAGYELLKESEKYVYMYKLLYR